MLFVNAYDIQSKVFTCTLLKVMSWLLELLAICDAKRTLHVSLSCLGKSCQHSKILPDYEYLKTTFIYTAQIILDHTTETPQRLLFEVDESPISVALKWFGMN